MNLRLPIHVPDILSFKLQVFSNNSFILRRVRFPDILKKTGSNEKHNSNQPCTGEEFRQHKEFVLFLSLFASTESLMIMLSLSLSILLRHEDVIICSTDCSLFTMPVKKAQPYPPGKLRFGRTQNQSGQSQMLPTVVKRGKTLPSKSQRLCRYL